MACSFFTRILGMILFIIPMTLAGVYITEPWADSKWTACQCQTLSWKDDAHPPHLFHMTGPAVADLYTEAGHYTASVQIDDIKSGSVTVCLPDPCTIEYRSSQYEVRINADDKIYWSHSFNITNIRCSPNACNPQKHPQAFVAAESDTILSDARTKSSASSEILHQTTVPLAVTSSPVIGVPQNKPSVSTASTVPAASSDTPLQPASFGLQSHRNGASTRFTKSGHWLDSEKMKFRLVFIVWPALVGISMAL
ncbi:hypothetical protein E1B28_006031 [Marasmius oreades]|uniref:Uncharacterized protein n=1 Tax=Marasmius oreades TaxID=181124 RepID=A0A9P7S4W3_9AGAR|nr:uncharacterized protein E1B28_006031 [Marasmius oreades]KAG7095258.1 hypothetical protein E1B28_006031 [Marasmius oreades]